MHAALTLITVDGTIALWATAAALIGIRADRRRKEDA